MLVWNQSSTKWQVYTTTYGEDLTVTNGVATVTLANTPVQILGVYLNGGRMEQTHDWTISGTTITFTANLSTTGETDKVYVDYIH